MSEGLWRELQECGFQTYVQMQGLEKSKLQAGSVPTSADQLDWLFAFPRNAEMLAWLTSRLSEKQVVRPEDMAEYQRQASI